jgi:peroxiredoxin
MTGLKRGLAAVALLASFAAPSALADEVAEVGKRPPLFALSDEHGDVHRLEDVLGKPIVLYFTHNMCHYCTQVIGFLKRAHEKYKNTDFTIITMNVWASDEKFIRRYKEQFGLPFAMLAAKDPKVLKDYEVNYVPIIVFIGRDGKIRYIYRHYILRGDFDRSVADIVEN